MPDGVPEFLRFKELANYGVSYSRRYVRELEVNGFFPRSVKLTPGRVVWVKQEILDWVQARINARPPRVRRRRKHGNR